MESMEQAQLPEWETLLIDEAIAAAERRYENEKLWARHRAIELDRQRGYHRLALEIDRPEPVAKRHPGQLSFFPTDPTLFDDIA